MRCWTTPDLSSRPPFWRARSPTKSPAATATGRRPPPPHATGAAAAALELACWDLNAKLNDEPAYATIARHFGREPVPAVAVYAAGGYYYYPDRGINGLRDEMRGYLDLGYDAVKMKIGGALAAMT